MVFYQFPIDFYEHGYKNRPFVANEWKKYFEKWPFRHSNIHSIERQSGSAASGEVTVGVKYSFTWVGDSGQPAEGYRTSLITWRKFGRNWKIKGLKEKVWVPDQDE